MYIVAIIGPYRARWWWQRWGNIRRATAVARQVWQLGAVAYLPHRMTASLNGHIADDVILPGLLELCRRCDAGILVEGWQGSEGSLLEKNALYLQDTPVFYALDDLRKWLES